MRKLQESEVYRKVYGEIVDYFALPVNGGKPVPFARPGLPSVGDSTANSEKFGVKVKR